MARPKHFVIILSEIRRLMKDKAIIMALAIQIFMVIASTSLLSGVALSYAGSVEETRGVIVAISGSGEVADSMEARLRNVGMSVLRVGSLEDLTRRPFDSRLGAFIRADSRSLEGEGPIQIDVVIAQSLKAASVTRAIRLALEELQEFARKTRNVETDPTWKLWSSYVNIRGDRSIGDPSFVYYIFEMIYTAMLPLLLIMPMIIAGGLLSESIIEEKERRTISLLLTAPLTRLSIYNARILVYTVFALGQTLLSVIIYSWAGISFAELGHFFIIAAPLALDFCILGCLISSLSSTKTMSQLAYSFTTASLLTMGFVVPGSLINLLAKLAGGTPYSGILEVASLPLLAGIPLYLVLMSRAKSEED